MKTRAWDGQQWRTDYVVMPGGEVWATEEGLFYPCLPVYKTNWKLSRFTGHVDKHSNEIYEGNICRIFDDPEDTCLAQVEWDDDMCAFMFVTMHDSYVYADVEPEIKIIGDIFTTPELLEENS